MLLQLHLSRKHLMDNTDLNCSVVSKLGHVFHKILKGHLGEKTVSPMLDLLQYEIQVLLLVVLPFKLNILKVVHECLNSSRSTQPNEGSMWIYLIKQVNFNA